MADTATRLGVKLRPHLKTAKTVEAALVATGRTKRSCCVSTVAELEFFLAAGFGDIVYAVPPTAEKVLSCK